MNHARNSDLAFDKKGGDYADDGRVVNGTNVGFRTGGGSVGGNFDYGPIITPDTTDDGSGSGDSTGVRPGASEGPDPY